MARERGFEPRFSGPKPDVLPLDDSRMPPRRYPPVDANCPASRPPASLTPLMGSLIKKRRKRMRKKKHKKMLKATRWQRRAGR